MSNTRLRVGPLSNTTVRVGQQNSIKVLTSAAGALALPTSLNVIGGIASITELYVSGVSTFVGIATFINDVYIGGNLYIKNDLNLDEITTRNTNITENANIAGIVTVSGAFYYGQYTTGALAYFDNSGLMVSTGSTNDAVDYTNYILTTNNSGEPTWSNTIDGGTY
jgi:hypothetical protein